MDLTERLYAKIVDAGIELISFDTGKRKAITMEDVRSSTYAIFFSYANFSNRLEEFIVLAHEYGHCQTGCTHTVHSPFQLIGQHEERANRYAVHAFLPFDEIIKEVNRGNNEAWQIADALGMPEAFIKLALDTYSREGKIQQ